VGNTYKDGQISLTKNETKNNLISPVDSDKKDDSAKLRALLNAAVDSIIIIDDKGSIELFNAAAQLMFGYDSDSVVGKNVNILMPQPYQSEHDQYLRHYMETNEKRIIGLGREVKAQRSNGEIFPVELSVGEVEDSSHTQFVGIIRDISEQVQARSDAINSRERLAHVTRLSTMGEMAAGIAHEINQPLTAVASYAHASRNMLEACADLNSENALLKQKILNTLQKISDQAIRAGEVIRRLRAFVKQRKVEQERVELNSLIKETVELAKVDTRLLDHGVNLNLSAEPKAQLNVDPVQIQQVLFNLIRNAIDAMEEQLNEPVCIISRWLDNGFIEISVSDTGSGVDEESEATLFNPFFSTKDAGMGMGLPISQSIIVAHGGELTYTHGIPRGSVFSFTLPAKPLVIEAEQSDEN
jgi:two-component system sensor kinase FixL